jgi:hypothetical protein
MLIDSKVKASFYNFARTIYRIPKCKKLKSNQIFPTKSILAKQSYQQFIFCINVTAKGNLTCQQMRK